MFIRHKVVGSQSANGGNLKDTTYAGTPPRSREASNFLALPKSFLLRLKNDLSSSVSLITLSQSCRCSTKPLAPGVISWWDATPACHSTNVDSLECDPKGFLLLDRDMSTMCRRPKRRDGQRGCLAVHEPTWKMERVTVVSLLNDLHCVTFVSLLNYLHCVIVSFLNDLHCVTIVSLLNDLHCVTIISLLNDLHCVTFVSLLNYLH